MDRKYQVYLSIRTYNTLCGGILVCATIFLSIIPLTPIEKPSLIQSLITFLPWFLFGALLLIPHYLTNNGVRFMVRFVVYIGVAIYLLYNGIHYIYFSNYNAIAILAALPGLLLSLSAPVGLLIGHKYYPDAY